MKLELKEVQVLIFKNEMYKEGERTPEYRGGLTLDGQMYNIALWVQTSKNGRKYFAGTVQMVENETEQKKPTEDLPF